MQLPEHSQLQKQGCWVTQPCLSQQVSNSPLTVWKSSLWPTKRVKSLAQLTDSARQRETPSLKCKWGVLQAGSTELAELFLPHLLGGTSRRSSRWERSMCGVSLGFHLLLHKQKLLQCCILHHSQVALARVVFKSFPPDYPRASGTQPCDTTVWTRPSHFSQSTADLCALGRGVPQSFLWSLSLSTYFTPA